MGKTKQANGKATKADPLKAVKSAGITKATDSPKAKSKSLAKNVATKAVNGKKEKKDTKKKKVESESESDSDDSESDDDADSSEDSDASDAASADSSEEDSDSDSSESEEETTKKPAAKINGKAVSKPATNGKAKPTKSDSESDSDSASESSESSDSDDEVKADAKDKAKAAVKGGAKMFMQSSDDSDDSEEDSDSDDSSESDEEIEKKVEEKKPESKKRKAEEEVPTPFKKNKNDANSADEDEYVTLFVGNLGWGVDDNALYEAFQECAEINNARVVTDKAMQRSRGFGYVDFNTHEGAKAAFEKMNGFELQGRALRLDPSKPRPAEDATPYARANDRAQKFGDSVSPESDTLFVGNLPFEVDEDMVSTFFGEVAEVASLRLPTDP
ncbi:hypothetical protein F5Y15DRAFT_376194 [Xylariaceae sp. FL0016]|nr:hypothetical protein F5Y15DRAFT_376194 [Xylariaceae sp. FL0016]